MSRSPDVLIERAVDVFSTRFGGRPTACGMAPGRVEILGNHTDYNKGCVLTAAIDRHVVAVGRPINDNIVRARSLTFDTPVEFHLDQPPPKPDASWDNYVKSVFAVLRSVGAPVGGVELIIASDVPPGAGLASSAALEAAVAMLVLELYPYSIESLELAALLQRGEHEFTGVQCGLLDQFSSLHGRSDCVIFLDCASLHHEALSLEPRPPAIVICDSGVRRQLGRDAPYNIRRRECEAARQQFSRLLGRALSGLCDVSPAELLEIGSEIPEPILSRARHVIGEHERVIAACDHLRAGQTDRLGALMIESHKSSQKHFDNSCAALDRLCDTAAGRPGYLGGRLCGAGWGGCTVNLVASAAVDDFLDGMRRSLESRPDHAVPELYVCHASDAARAERL